MYKIEIIIFSLFLKGSQFHQCRKNIKRKQGLVLHNNLVTVFLLTTHNLLTSSKWPIVTWPLLYMTFIT